MGEVLMMILNGMDGADIHSGRSMSVGCGICDRQPLMLERFSWIQELGRDLAHDKMRDEPWAVSSSPSYVLQPKDSLSNTILVVDKVYDQH